MPLSRSWIAIVPLVMAASAAPAPAAPSRACVLDEAALLRGSTLAADMATRFQQVRDKAQRRYNADQALLDADGRAFDAQRATLPPAAVAQRAAELEQRRAALEQRRSAVDRDLADLDAQLTGNALKLSLPAIRTIEVAAGCSMLIARGRLIDLVDPSLDITSDVLRATNARAPTAMERR